jgi:hypothetical protein
MWQTGKAFENLQNNSICVLLDNKYIRKMKFIEDATNERLVLVSNVPKSLTEKDDCIIYSGEMCRYNDIMVLLR